MSIANTITQLQMLHRTITGIVTAPDAYPGSINTADLPLVIVWPKRAISRPLTARALTVRSERIYSVRVFMEAIGQDNYDTPVQNGIVMLNRFLTAYFQNTTLADGYTQIVQVEDSGLTAGGDLVATASLVYAGNFYKGFVCDITVIEVCD